MPRDRAGLLGPVKPTDNALIESFNGKFRAKCLNARWFWSLAVAKEQLETYRSYYNDIETNHPTTLAEL
jgi:hypothetical protein